MKILFLSNDEISEELISWLKNVSKEDVVTQDGPVSMEFLKKIRPDFVISYNYRYIIKKEVIDRMRDRIINLHISFLPWNKGPYPNVWSFLENTPRGVTIHIIDEGVDTGHILIQKEVFIDEDKETLKSSYEELHKEIQELFKNHWDNIKNGKLKPKPQTLEGSIRYRKDFERIKPLLINEGWDISIIEFKKRYKDLIGGNDVSGNN